MRSFFMKLFFRKIFFCQSDGSSGKKEDTDQVRDCHERICYIRKAPYKIKCLCAAKFKNAFSP